MTERQPQRPGPGPDDRGPSRRVRFEATIHAGRKARAAGRIDDLDIDLIPDPRGRVRALLTAEDCVRLLDRGFEVRLHHAHPVRPLDPRLIETDESVRRQLEERFRGVDRAGGPGAAAER